MKYGLSSPVVESIIPITEDEYDRISAATDALLAYTALEEKFDLVAENYIEFETSLLQIATQMMLQGGHNHGSMHAQRRLLNRRLTNLLSSAQTYIDCSGQHLADMKPGDKQIVDRLKKRFSEQYDQRLGYRAMVCIRNHAQHFDDPVHGISFPSKWDKERTKLQFTVILHLHPQQLSFNSKFKKSVLKELIALGPIIDLKPLTRGFVEALSIVHEGTRQETKAIVAGLEEVITATIGKFEEAHPRAKTVGLAAVRILDSGEHDQPVNLMKDFLSYFDVLRKKNKLGANVSDRCVTGEILD